MPGQHHQRGSRRPIEPATTSTHLLGGDITAFTIKNDISDARPLSATLVSGANDIKQSPRNGQFYATSRFAGSVVAFRPVFDTNADVAAGRRRVGLALRGRRRRTATAKRARGPRLLS